LVKEENKFIEDYKQKYRDYPETEVLIKKKAANIPLNAE